MADTPALTHDASGSSSSAEWPCSPKDANTDAMDVDMTDIRSSSPSNTLAVKRKQPADTEPKPKQQQAKKAKLDKSAQTPVELKNSRLVCKQKPFAIAEQIAAVEERVQLAKHLSGLAEVDEIPEEHHPAVAKLIQESDKGVLELARHLVKTLCPTISSSSVKEDEKERRAKEKSAIAAFKATIEAIATRTNYGIDGPESVQVDTKASTPAGLCIWRWEVDEKDAHLGNSFGKDIMNKIKARVDERVLIQKKALELVKALDDEARTALFEKKKAAKKEAAEAEEEPKKGKVTEAKQLVSPEVSEMQADAWQTEEEKAEKERIKAEKAARKAERDAAKAERDAAKAERDAAKAEKQAKEALKAKTLSKQSGAFSAFFGKPKPAATTPVAASTSAAPSLQIASSSPIIVKSLKKDKTASEFERSFKPFFVGQNCDMAPANRFRRAPSGKPLSELVDSDATLELKGCLADLLKRVPKKRLLPYKPRPVPADSVKSLMQKISEGSLVNGATSLYFARLRNRQVIPVKVLSFQATDRRPGYIGTFSKGSTAIRPRRPFGRDAGIFNYDYDSEEEWDEEDAAEGEDVNSEGAKSAAEDDDDDSDAGSLGGEGGWMCDDDEVEYQEGYDPDLDVAMNGEGDNDAKTEMDRQQRAQKKKEQNLKYTNARKKALKPLVPFYRGPEWESSIGQVSYQGFNSMRIEYLNDAPRHLNPLEFVSTMSSLNRKKAAKADEDVFGTGAKDSTTGNSTGSDIKSGRGKSKRPFPAHLVSDFISAVLGSRAETKAALQVELSAKFSTATKVSIDQMLKEHVKKMNSKDGKRWQIDENLARRTTASTEEENATVVL